MPLRSCVVCRAKAEQSTLVRVRMDDEGHLAHFSECQGRSAYACKSARCCQGLTTKGFLERAFRKPVAMEARQELEARLQALLPG